MDSNERKALLDDADWREILAVLTGYAYQRTKLRSWHYAEDLAADAIRELFEEPEAWDPEKDKLVTYLARSDHGPGLQRLARPPKLVRISMSDEDEEHEASPEDNPEQMVNRMWVARIFRERLSERLKPDEKATAILLLILDDVTHSSEQRKASGLSLEAIIEARRRIYYAGDAVTREMARELDLSSTGRTLQ